METSPSKMFRFPTGIDKDVLREISLSFEAGKLTALVGASGGGKTTILALLAGLLPPHTPADRNRRRTSIHDVSLKSLRQNISYLDQDAFLFEGTIEDNIVGASDIATRAESQKRRAAQPPIRSLTRCPKAMTRQLRELSTNLSGGQKQRIAIARAFYKNAPILLLDEPTSALDSDTEQQIRNRSAIWLKAGPRS